VTGQSNLNAEPLDQELPANDALGNMKFPEPSLVLRALHRLRIHRLVWLYGFLLELRSLIYRMKRLRRTDLHRTGLDIGPAFEKTPDGRFQECIRTHACSEGIRNLYATWYRA
jgi:hypothetical protein